MTSSYNASFKGIGEMLCSEFIGAALVVKAEKVKESAKAIAPVNEKSATHYRDAFHVGEPALSAGSSGKERMHVTVYNDDAAALQIEYGTPQRTADKKAGRIKAHHVLLKALDAVKDD